MKSISWKDLYGEEMGKRWDEAKKNNKKVDLKVASKEISARWKKIKAGEDSEYSAASSGSSSSSSKTKSKTKSKKGKNKTKKKREDIDEIDEEELTTSYKKSKGNKNGHKIIDEIKKLLSKLEDMF